MQKGDRPSTLQVPAWCSADYFPPGDAPCDSEKLCDLHVILRYKSKPTETGKAGDWNTVSYAPLRDRPHSAASAYRKTGKKPPRGPSVLALTLISCSKRLCICSSCISCFLLSWFWLRCSSFWSSRSSRSSWRLRVKRCGHRSQNSGLRDPRTHSEGHRGWRGSSTSLGQRQR